MPTAKMCSSIMMIKSQLRMFNRLRIKEGRLPQNDKECVVKYESTREAVKVGDVLKFKSGTSDDINDTFKDTEYTVVGVVYSPCFVSYDLGSSDIGNGNISYCVYVGDDEFKNDYYTEAYAVVDSLITGRRI